MEVWHAEKMPAAPQTPAGSSLPFHNTLQSIDEVHVQSTRGPVIAL